jgi:hypothetical protein
MVKPLAQLLTRFDPNVLILLLLPWLLVLSNDIWMFDLHLYIDPWLYLGFFLRLKQYLTSFGGETYYATRLPLLLPGHVIFNLFPPLVAQYVLHIGFYYAAVLSLYTLLKHLLSQRVALLTSVMMGCYGWFLWAISSNYPDSSGLTYYSLTLLMVVLAALSARWRLFTVLSGVFCALTIFSNLTWISLTPPLLFLYVWLNRLHRKHAIAPSIGFAFLGVIGMTAILALINFLLNQKWLFFLPSLNAASQLIFVLKSPWHGNLIEVLPNASWLMLLISSVVGSLSLLALSIPYKRFPIQPNILGLQIFFLLSFLIFFSLEIGRFSTFQYHWYTSYLIPATFLGIGAQLAQLDAPLSTLKPRSFWLVVGGIILLPLIAFRLPLALEAFRGQVVWIMVGCSLIWVTLAIAVWRFPPQVPMLKPYLVLTVLVTFSVINTVSIVGLNRLSYVNHLNSQLTSRPPFSASAPPMQDNIQHHRDAFINTIAAQKVLQQIDPKVQALFWYDLQESFLYRSIASASFWSHLSESFPKTGLENATPEQTKQTIALLESRPMLVVLTQQPNAFEQAKTALQQIGYEAQWVDAQDFQQGANRFTMLRIKTRKISQ